MWTFNVIQSFLRFTPLPIKTRETLVLMFGVWLGNKSQSRGTLPKRRVDLYWRKGSNHLKFLTHLLNPKDSSPKKKRSLEKIYILQNPFSKSVSRPCFIVTKTVKKGVIENSLKIYTLDDLFVYRNLLDKKKFLLNIDAYLLFISNKQIEWSLRFNTKHLQSDKMVHRMSKLTKLSK